MKKIYCFTFVLCIFLALISKSPGQEFSITQFGAQDTLPLGADGPGILILVPQGAQFEVSTPSLTTFTATIADEGRIFSVSPGDFLSNNTINSFTPLIGNNDFSINNLPSLPFGESVIGFASRGGAGGAFHTFGYAQILRTSDTLEVLATDSVFAGFGSPPDASFGIAVPTPEPSSALLGALGLMAMGLSRRRSR